MLAQECVPSDQAKRYAKDNREVYFSAVRKVVRDHIRPLIVNSGGDHRALLHAMSLANVQMFESSARCAENYVRAIDSAVKPLWKAKAWLLLSSCYHNLSKYRRSEFAALQAVSLSRKNRFTKEAIHALANVDEARRMQLDLSLRLGVPWVCPKIICVVLVVRLFVDSLRLAWWAGSTRIEQGLARHDDITSILIEHRIRFLAMLQRPAIAIVGRIVAAGLFGGLWKWLQRLSREVGYTA